MIEAINGVVVVDKPVGPTSFAVVRKVRHATGARKVGHGGTLDPLASGVLPICFGEATKLAQFLLDADKEYEATIRFGAETDTYDAAGAITSRRPAGHLREHDVLQALSRFVGEQPQIPPMYSALKREGRPLYAYARAGETVERAARTVTIHALELREFGEAPAHEQLSTAPQSHPPAARGPDSSGAVVQNDPWARVFIRCSKGTYVRSLAHDLGAALGTGAHLTALRRTRSGPFSLQGAIPLDLLGTLPLPLVSPADALSHLPTVVVSAEVACALERGQVVTWERAGGPPGSGDQGLATDTLVRLLGPDRQLLAVAPAGGPADPIHTLRVFNAINLLAPEEKSRVSS